MAKIKPPIPVNLKDKVVSIEEDNIDLYSHQLNAVQSQARRKTEMEWLSSPSGIKITLTRTQQEQIVDVKDQLFNFMSPNKDPKEVLNKTGNVGFTSHAFDRILERVERFSREEIEKNRIKTIIDPETLEKIIEALIRTKNVFYKAEWKGSPYLNYTFLCELEGRKLDIVVNFETNILIITIVVSKETGYFVREVYSYDEKENTYIKKLN